MQDLIEYLIKEAGLETEYYWYWEGEYYQLKQDIYLCDIAPTANYVLYYDDLEAYRPFKHYLLTSLDPEFDEVIEQRDRCVPISKKVYDILSGLYVGDYVDYAALAAVLNKYSAAPVVSFHSGHPEMNGNFEFSIPLYGHDEFYFNIHTYGDLVKYEPDLYEDLGAVFYVTEDFKEMFDKPIPKTDWSKVLK